MQDRDTMRTTGTSRRQALVQLAGAANWMPGAMATPSNVPLRFAISESVIAAVNLNDARAALQVWIQRFTSRLNVEMDSKLLISTQELQDRTRKGQVDAVALNVIEYRPIADWLDPSQVVSSAGETGLDQYFVVVKRSSGINHLKDLKGGRMQALKTPQMCMAPVWLMTILDEAQLGRTEQFFGSTVEDSKLSRVILPVFFGQAEACLTSKRGFDSLCELNPQVARELKVIANSAPMVVNFYVFRKNYQHENREKFIKALLDLRASAAGAQLAMLFHFNQVSVRDASCLTPSLSVLEAAERIRRRRGAGDHDHF
jgi:ABC-type phosphate/phosphonate transport system substrate-binding protein